MSIRIAETSVAHEHGVHEQHTLYVNDVPVAHVQVRAQGVSLNWEIHGPQYWPEAKWVLEGLLELSLLADRLSLRTPNDQARQEKLRAKKASAEVEEEPVVLNIRYGSHRTPATTGKQDRPGAKVARRPRDD